MKFEKITVNGITEYKVEDKVVTEETYNKINEDDTVAHKSFNSKISNQDYVNSEFNLEDEGEECMCPECQEVYEIVSDIQEMDFDAAVAMLRQYLDDYRTEIRLSTMIECYEQLGQSLLKVSGKLESELEDHISKYDEGIEGFYEE